MPEPGKPAMPKVWTLWQVEAEERIPGCSGLFVVENPAVFSTILDSMPRHFEFDGDPPILFCTSGAASAAAIRFLEKCLRESGTSCRLAYSGDFDVKGLFMGQTLAGLFPEHFTPWRFALDTYQALVRRNPGPPLDESELSLLSNMEVPWDQSLCESMERFGRKVHQETFVEELIGDFYRNVR